MTRMFVFRSWPASKVRRMREMWWDGKNINEIARILNVTNPKAVYEKIMAEGFVRDPRRLAQGSKDLLPMPRPDGQLVTQRNCEANECRWPYGPPSPDMVMCGRATVVAPYCAGHHKLTTAAKKAADA